MYLLYITFRVKRKHIQFIIIPSTIQTSGGDTSKMIVIADKGIRLQSSLPVYVYALSGNLPELSRIICLRNFGYLFYSSDAYAILPTTALGTRYRSISSRLNRVDSTNSLVIVATVDNTLVKFDKN